MVYTSEVDPSQCCLITSLSVLDEQSKTGEILIDTDQVSNDTNTNNNYNYNNDNISNNDINSSGESNEDNSEQKNDDENKDNDPLPVLAIVTLPYDYSLETPICRICHCEGDIDRLDIKSSNNECSTVSSIVPIPESLIAPCCCSGSLRYVHHYCLQQWIRSSNNKYCELCKYHFKMSVKYKPVYKWERLEMSNGEWKKLFYNLLFNIISLFCVFWSIYVLIERATFEIRHGLLKWPFWTIMLVVSIGFLGGSLFLFIQLRIYLSVFLKWRQYNRVIIIHNNNSCDSNVPQDKKAKSNSCK